MAVSTGKGRTPREGANLQVRRNRVFDRWCRGEMQQDIADSFGVSRGVISMDIQLSLKEWREANRGSVGEMVEMELGLLNATQLKADAEWERTQDPRFLDLVIKCGVERRKLLGLDAPQRTESKNTTDVNVRTFKPKKEMQSIVAASLEKLRRQRAPSLN